MGGRGMEGAEGRREGGRRAEEESEGSGERGGRRVSEGDEAGSVTLSQFQLEEAPYRGSGSRTSCQP